MNIAFYAPLKAPTHPVPSGDRKIARLLVAALRRAGHEVSIASRLRSWDGKGDTERQQRLRHLGQRLAQRLLRRYLALPIELRPQLWFTYHLYHKTPDWLGPLVSKALGIPYVVCEASYAPKRAGGPWSMGLEATESAIRQADAVIALKSHDLPCLRPLVDDPDRLTLLKPFLDTGLYDINPKERGLHRDNLAHRYDLNKDLPWLLTVAMMRPGNKLRSFHMLADALRQINDRQLCLLVVGDGAARNEVERHLKAVTQHQIIFTGLQTAENMLPYYAATDLFAWPAIEEPFGMAMLEAQAAGLPVVAGRDGGVPDMVVDGVSGILVKPGDQVAFAEAITTLCNNPEKRNNLGFAAHKLARQDHDIRTAAAALNKILSLSKESSRP
ncbi:glycosyltransferase family 4 protein [Pseudomonadota bacterium]